MKRDSKYFGNYREELLGGKLYLRNIEPVLRYLLGYTGNAHYSVRVSKEISVLAKVYIARYR